MSDLTVFQLAEKFKQLGDTQETTGFPNSARIARQCADELEAALPRLAELVRKVKELTGKPYMYAIADKPYKVVPLIRADLLAAALKEAGVGE